MELLDQAYEQEKYLNFLADKFNFSKSLQAIIIANNDVKKFKQLGFISTADNKQLPIFEIYIKPNTKLARNRVQLRNLVAKQIKTEDGALAVYVDENSEQWRFSFIAIEYELGENGIKKKQTASKRFTYLFGEGTQTITAKNRFKQLNKQSTLENLKTAFAVGTLTDDFYKDIYKWYLTAQSQVTFPNDEGENQQKHTQNSLIRLLTRLLFVWFLKEKHLINPDLFNLKELKNLINWQQDSSFYKAILQNLFFATLSTEINNRKFSSEKRGNKGWNKDFGNQYVFRYQELFQQPDKIKDHFNSVPFLNGGLFECLDDKKNKKYIDGFSRTKKHQPIVANNLFFNADETGLIDLLGYYQFTIEENTPLDIEVALDPELLGKVFENLLAIYNHETGEQARKATGSFYTPREIVSYMVDESLKQHFKTHTNLTQKDINTLFIEGENPPNEKQIKTIVSTINSLKILDPAVGSGAYPMGVLQRLVFILEKIDPENKHFKQQQLDKAELMDEASKNASIKAIEQVFSTENQHNAYGKKLFLIENCIYGVDIQAIAIQICKLRFFISLTIEQTADKSKENYGIKALPNLETKFIVANTLLPLGKIEVDKNETIGLFDEGIGELQRDLAKTRHQYFTAKTLRTKRKYREEDKQLRQQMQIKLKDKGITLEVETSMQKVVAWDLYNQNAQSDWFDPEWMFGVKEGFDIVIGNPPYISHDKIPKEDKILIKNNYKSYEPFADLYCYFFEKSINLQKEKGVLSLITSNSFLRAEYGKLTRNFLSKNNILLQILNIHKSQVFDKAIVNVSIIISCKTKDNITCNVANSEINNKFNRFMNNTFAYEQFYFDEAPWTLIKPELIKLRNKIKSAGKSLEELKTKIRLGIATGNNKAFIIDENKKQELCKTNPNNNNIIKPILRGRDVYKYSYNISGLYVLLTKNGVNVQRDYPEIYNHLLSFGDGFRNRGAQGQHWTNLRACSFYDDFKKDKIIWIELTDRGRFALSTEEVYLLNSAYYLIPPNNINSKFLLSILNSRIIYFYLELIAETSGMGTNRWINNYVKQLPIPQVSKFAQQPFVKLVDKILIAKQDDKDTADLETKIDKMVYNLYNLTADEIKIIEKAK